MTPDEEADLRHQVQQATALARLAFETAQAHGAEALRAQQTMAAGLQALGAADVLLHNRIVRTEALCAALEAFATGKGVKQAFEAVRERFRQASPEHYNPEFWGERPEWMERMMKGPAA